MTRLPWWGWRRSRKFVGAFSGQNNKPEYVDADNAPETEFSLAALTPQRARRQGGLYKILIFAVAMSVACITAGPISANSLSLPPLLIRKYATSLATATAQAGGVSISISTDPNGRVLTKDT